MSFLLTANDGTSAVWSREVLRAGASQLEDDAEVLLLDAPGKEYDLIIDVTPVHPGSGYQVRREAGGTTLTTDGTYDQAMAVGAWARGLLPNDLEAELWIVDDAYLHRAIIAAGADAAQVAAAWAEID